jgi:hypothetical protein
MPGINAVLFTYGMSEKSVYLRMAIPLQSELHGAARQVKAWVADTYEGM